MDAVTELVRQVGDGAVLDEAHIGDIRGALGTIRHGDIAPRNGWSARIRTLLAILGPGLIVMVGDNDAGAFGTYTQAAQNYGTTLLWTLALLIPVLYVNQEMVLRLGTVTGVGHARLILERFGRFWGAFSVIDLFLLNALTIVTEFIGITLALDYLGLSREFGVMAAAAIIIAAAGTGDFRRFERFSLLLVFGSLLLVPKRAVHAVDDTQQQGSRYARLRSISVRPGTRRAARAVWAIRQAQIPRIPVTRSNGSVRRGDGACVANRNAGRYRGGTTGPQQDRLWVQSGAAGYRRFRGIREGRHHSVPI
jgi:hypothetical protein